MDVGYYEVLELGCFLFCFIYIYIYIYIYDVYNTWGGCACRNFLLGCPDNVWGDELSVYSIHKRGDT